MNQLTVFLNNHHKKEHSKRYWSIILGPWLWRFISAMSFKWNLIHSIKKKYVFHKKEIDPKKIIPLGIEDYQKIKNTNYWNHYCYSKIIEHSFSNKFYIKNYEKINEYLERDQIYDNLKKKNLKERISLLSQKILNFFPQNKKILIYSTYMSNLNEVKLNLLLNKSLLYYKSLRPFFLFEKKDYFNFKEKN